MITIPAFAPVGQLQALAQQPAPLTMTSREIAELTDKRHDHVLRDIEKMLAELGTTSPQIWGDLEDSYGRPQRVAFLPKRETLILVSGYSVQMRACIIDRWQQLEAQVAAAAPAPAFTIPATFSSALMLAAQQQQQIEHQQAQLALAAPKVEFVKRYVEAPTLKGFREVAKLLGANEARFREFLIDGGVMYRLADALMAHQNHIDAGRFAVKAGASERTGHAYHRAMFTTKGVEWISERWREHCKGGENA